MKNTNEKILIVAPHHDDEVIGCGGTIQWFKDKSDEVAVLYVFNGSSGVQGMTGGKASRTRMQEAIESSKILGYKILGILNFKDRQGASINKIQKGLIRAFRSYQPSILFCPHEEEQDLEHKIVNRAVWEAKWFSETSNFPELGKNRTKIISVLGYEIWTPIKRPNFFIDISKYIALKKKALSCFKTQIDGTNWLEGALGLNSYRGTTLIGFGSAEAFNVWSTNLIEFINFFRK